MYKQLCKLGLRKCYVCKQMLPLDFEHFYRSKRKGLAGFMTRCKKCDKERDKKRICEGRKKHKRLVNNEYKGYVYIIKCNDYYKIGITKHDDIGKRILDMQCGNPYKLELYNKYYNDDMYFCENFLHKHFIKKLIRGERYCLCNDDLKHIDNYFIK